MKSDHASLELAASYVFNCLTWYYIRMEKRDQHYLDAIHIVGMAIAWAIMLVPTSYQYFALDYDSSAFNAATIMFLLGGTIASFVVVSLVRRSIDVPFPLLLMGGLLFAVGNSVTYFAEIASLLPRWVTFVSSFLQGAGTALFILSWVQVSSKLFPESFARDIASSLAGGALILAAIAVLHNCPRHAWLWPFLAVFMTIVSLVCSCVAIKKQGLGSLELSVRDNVTNPYFVPFAMEIFFCIIGFSLLLCHIDFADLRSPFDAALSLSIAILVLAAFLALARIKSTAISSTRFAKLSCTVLVFGIVLGFISPEVPTGVLRALVFAGALCTFFGLLLALKNASDEQGVSKSYTFALGFTFFYFGGCLAEICLLVMNSIGGGNPMTSGLDTKALLALVLLALFVGIALLPDSDAVLSNSHAKGATLNLAQASSDVAEKYDLTKRQAEVLSLLVQGKRVSDIEKALTISNGTARAHVRAIYGKCSVHSQSELMNLVIEAASRHDA